MWHLVVKVEDEHKTKEQLIKELVQLRRQIAELERQVKQEFIKRKQIEEAIKFAYLELNQIFETAADGIRVVGKDFKVLRVNKTFLTLSGTSRDEAVGKKCYEVFHGPLCSTPNCPLVRVLRGEGRVECEVEKERKDGTKIACILTATPFRGPNGEIIGIVEDFKDITQRKQAEEELREHRAHLEKLVEERTADLRNLSAYLQSVREQERANIAREIHDELGQALTVLKMDLSWLARRLPKVQKPLFEKTKSMSKLIDFTIQTVRRISTELRPRLLDDLGLAAAVEWQAEEFQKRTGIRCEVSLDPEDIALDRDLSTAIFRIFQETLTNVARHADATSVKVTLEEKTNKLVLKVRDNGKGITKIRFLIQDHLGLLG